MRLALLAMLGIASTSEAEILEPRTLWSFQTEGPIRGSAVVGGDSVYFGSADGCLYAVSKGDGRLRWKFQTGGPIAGAPALAGDTVVVSGRGDQVYALNVADGRVLWSFRMMPLLATPTEWNYFTAAPVIDGSQVLVASGDGRLYALELVSGKPLWSFVTADSLRAAPLVDGGTIYQPSGDDHLYALSAANGKLLWKYATAGVGYDLSKGFIRSDIFTRPSLQDGLLVFGSRDANVYAIDVSTRRKKWSFAYDSTWAMSSTVDAGTVYVGWSTNNRVNALDLATGTKKWEFDAGSHTYTAALIHGSHVYWGSANGRLYKLDKSSGALSWKYEVGSEIYSSPVREGDILYFGADDGRLRAVGEGGARPARAFYLPANVPANIASFVIDPALAPFMAERGYERLDSQATLAAWLHARLADARPSVLVFGFAQIPAAVIGEDPATGPLRGYLEGGGKVVWPWGIPNKVTFDEKGAFVAYDPKVAATLLDIEFVDFEDSGNYYNRATQDGRNWGLPAWLKATFASVKPASGIVPLAIDEYGRVSVFLKTFHARPGSGWITFSPKGFNVPVTAEELAMFERVASYGLR
jgi:eukaryotic-like serine/threonine-protein kinase